MKKRVVSLVLTCVLCLCLMPVAAQAADWYEVKPFYVEYFGSNEPSTGTKEMTVDGQTVTVSVFPSGTQFSSFNGLYIGETESYVDGVLSSSPFDPTAGLPAQGIYRIKLYSMYYGYEGDVWVTAEGSGTTAEPSEPDEPAAPSFTDVAADAYYTEPVAWAVEQGITSGTTSTTFSRA